MLTVDDEDEEDAIDDVVELGGELVEEMVNCSDDEAADELEERPKPKLELFELELAFEKTVDEPSSFPEVVWFGAPPSRDDASWELEEKEAFAVPRRDWKLSVEKYTTPAAAATIINTTVSETEVDRAALAIHRKEESLII